MKRILSFRRPRSAPLLVRCDNNKDYLDDNHHKKEYDDIDDDEDTTILLGETCATVQSLQEAAEVSLVPSSSSSSPQSPPPSVVSSSFMNRRVPRFFRPKERNENENKEEARTTGGNTCGTPTTNTPTAPTTTSLPYWDELRPSPQGTSPPASLHASSLPWQFPKSRSAPCRGSGSSGSNRSRSDLSFTATTTSTTTALTVPSPSAFGDTNNNSNNSSKDVHQRNYHDMALLDDANAHPTTTTTTTTPPTTSAPTTKRCRSDTQVTSLLSPTRRGLRNSVASSPTKKLPHPPGWDPNDRSLHHDHSHQHHQQHHHHQQPPPRRRRLPRLRKHQQPRKHWQDNNTITEQQLYDNIAAEAPLRANSLSHQRNPFALFSKQITRSVYPWRATTHIDIDTDALRVRHTTPPGINQQQINQSKDTTPPSVNSLKTFQIRLLQGQNLPLDSFCRVVLWLDEETTGTNHCYTYNTNNCVTLGETPTVVASEDGTAQTIWGSKACTFQFQGDVETTTLSLEIVCSVTNNMLHQLQVTVDQLLVKHPKQYPNQWCNFEDEQSTTQHSAWHWNPEEKEEEEKVMEEPEDENCCDGPRIQVRLTQISRAIQSRHSGEWTTRQLVWPSRTPVVLNVYDVSQNEKVQEVNDYLKPLGLGGIFHAAIEVHGREYSFGGSPHGGRGIYWYPPKECPVHHFRESIPLGDCELSKSQIKAILRALDPQWMASSYNLFRKNCCYFCRDLAIELGVGALPRWVYQLAQAAEPLEPFLKSLDKPQPQVRLPETTLGPCSKETKRKGRRVSAKDNKMEASSSASLPSQSKMAKVHRFIRAQTTKMTTTVKVSMIRDWHQATVQ